MAKASSSKKVQRAAKAAAQSRGASERREIGFPLLVIVLVVALAGLVWFARGSRDPVISPTIEDHWHSAYTVFDCGNRMPIFTGANDPDGIHSHGDSLIHIHPRNSSATGEDARVGVFLETMNAEITTEGIFANNGEFTPLLAADGCNGQPASIRAARWNLGAAGGPAIIDAFDDNFNDIRFLQDGEGFTFARVPVGEDPPPPPFDVITALRGVGSVIEYEAPPETDPVDPGFEVDPELTPIDPGTEYPTIPTEPTDTTETGETTEPTDTTEPSDTTETTEPTDPVETTEASESVETTEAPESVDTTEAPDTTETTEGDN